MSIVQNMTKPRERRQKRTRQAILDTALELIIENGADKLSLREIARRIDYSPAGLYEYFGSKDEIVETLCILGNEQLAKHLNTVKPDVSHQQRLIEMGLAYVRFARENPQLFKLLFTRFTPSVNEMPASANELDVHDSYGIVFREVEAAISDAVIQTQENYGTSEITYSVWALVHGLAVLQTTYLNDMRFDFENADRHAIEAFISGLMSKTD
jgi:AcrR family transcriptional regulator